MKKADIMIHAIRIGELNNRKELVELTGDKRKAFINSFYSAKDNNLSIQDKMALESNMKTEKEKYTI